MTVTFEQLKEMKASLAKAEKEYIKSKESLQREVISELDEIRDQLQKLMSRAEKLASSVDLVFYYNSNHDEFAWVEQDSWNF
jgi:tryptophanyl-tRNA synthetase